MQAKCPHCENGCDKCEGGHYEVHFAEGDCFTRVCTNKLECGFINGGYICEGFPSCPSGPCVICDSPTDWVIFDDLSEDNPFEMPGYVINEHKFYVKRLERNCKSLREKLQELRDLFLEMPGTASVKLAVKQAQLLNVCRICKKPVSAPFIVDFGEEYAHTRCLEEIGELSDRYKKKVQ